MRIRRLGFAALLCAAYGSTASAGGTGASIAGTSSTGASSGTTNPAGSSGGANGSASSNAGASSGGSTGGATTSTGSATRAGSTGGASAGSTHGSSSGGAGLVDGGFDPGQPGPYPVGSTLNLTETFASQSVPFDLYYPTAADGGAFVPVDGGVPEVLVSHGWLDSKSSFVGWGQHLASWGFAVAVPTWNNGMDDTNAPANAASANALLAWMDSEGATDPASPLYGLVDGKRHGFVGHSFGGLMVYLAASENPTVQVVAGLDPVDDSNDSAANAVAMIAGMGAMIPAQPALCDLNGNDQATVYANFPNQKLYAQVANAVHCDCQDPASSCQLTCGNVDPIRQMHFQRYATAALLWALECDARTLTWIDGAGIAADTGLSSTMNAGIACLPLP